MNFLVADNIHTCMLPGIQNVVVKVFKFLLSSYT